MLGYEYWKPEDIETLNRNKYIWHNATDEATKRMANEENKKLRAMYGMGDEDDISIGELYNYRTLAGRQNVQNGYKNELLKNITNNSMNENKKVRNAANALNNFNYNPYDDVVYKAYADAYNRQGQSAAGQTLNKLNAANMGRNSSYGSAATAQVQQAYAKQATDMIPQLAQQEYDRLLQRYGIEKDIADTMYNRQLSAYNAVGNQETRDIENDIRRMNREGTKIQLEFMPEQLKNDVESGRLANEISKLQIENMGYENRISAIAALIQETYGMRLADAEAVAAELSNRLYGGY